MTTGGDGGEQDGEFSFLVFHDEDVAFFRLTLRAPPTVFLSPSPHQPPSLPAPCAGAGALRETGRRRSDEQLDALADGLPADGAGLERRAAVDAGGVSALEDQLDVVVDADGAGDPLLHLPVA